MTCARSEVVLCEDAEVCERAEDKDVRTVIAQRKQKSFINHLAINAFAKYLS